MLQPKKSKYRKQFRGRMRGKSAGYTVNLGEYGLKALACAWLSANQIEAGRRAITRSTKRGGRLWIRIFPDKPITKKGAGAPLGAGKGDIEGYVAVVKPGRVIYEIAGVEEKIALEALRLASHKMPIPTKIIKVK